MLSGYLPCRKPPDGRAKGPPIKAFSKIARPGYFAAPEKILGCSPDSSGESCIVRQLNWWSHILGWASLDMELFCACKCSAKSGNFEDEPEEARQDKSSQASKSLRQAPSSSHSLSLIPTYDSCFLFLLVQLLLAIINFTFFPPLTSCDRWELSLLFIPRPPLFWQSLSFHSLLSLTHSPHDLPFPVSHLQCGKTTARYSLLPASTTKSTI